MGNLDFRVSLPVYRGPKFILLGGLGYEHLNIPRGLSTDADEFRAAQLERLYYMDGRAAAVFVQSSTWQHVASLLLGYGGDFRSIAAPGFKYVLSYNLMWSNGVDTRAGIGLNLTRVANLHLPLPSIVYTHKFDEHWLLQVLLPEKVNLRRRLSSRLFAGLFLRLNAKNYYLTERTRETADGGTETRVSGTFAVLRLEAGPEVEFELTRGIYLRVEGGALFENKVPFETRRTGSAAGTEALAYATTTSEGAALDNRITWFSGAGLSMRF